jgi:predicted transcriptional regulator
MIDFACKRFDLDDIIKCGLGLTRAEFAIMKYFLENKELECTTVCMAKEMKLNLTTVQKGVKKLNEKSVIVRHQKNLSSGGYVYTYECRSKLEIRRIVKGIIGNWFGEVEKKIDGW